MRAPRTPRTSRAPPRVKAPARLRAATLSVNGEELLVLQWPLARPALPDSLTPAEREVAELLLAGLSNPQIAARRRTAVRTVANQVAGVFTRLRVRSRLQLFAWAARRARSGGGT